jgi:outer membrane receptor protein involved in Fe transport
LVNKFSKQYMTRTLRYLFVLLFLGASSVAFGQAGDITGRVVDEKKEPVINAVVQAFDGGILKGTAVSDIDGNYDIKPLEPATYFLVVKALGFNDQKITDIVVSPDKTTGVNVAMEIKSNTLGAVTIVRYKTPLVDPYATGSNGHLDKDQIDHAPVLTTDELVALTPGVYQQSRRQDDRSGVSIGGSRSEGTLYIIDGVQKRGNYGTNLSQGSIEQIEVLTSGIPAKYGDVSGGVVNITTRGVSQNLLADVRLQHSIEGYNNNLVSFNLSGPLYKKTLADKSKKPVLGFALGGDFYYDNDRYPSYIKTYVAKPNVLKNLYQNPLTIVSDATGNQIYTYSSEYVTKGQLNAVNNAPDNTTKEMRLNGKLDYQLNDNLSLTAGANFNYKNGNYNNYNLASETFSLGSITPQQLYTGSGFIRFTQRFGKTATEKKDADSGPKSGTISNAYYTLQADYQRTYFLYQDGNYKNNVFDYGYVGKFNQNYIPNYLLSMDTATGRTGVVLQSTRNPSGVTYERSNMNPGLANYTSEYFNTVGTAPTSLSQIQASKGLVNGDAPALLYGLGIDNVGSGLGYYEKRDFDQYSVTVDASFDLQLGKTKHAIQFGLYYQQRIERLFVSYANQGGTASIWNLMRQLTNTQLSLDKANPTFLINGQRYTKDQVKNGSIKPSPFDTIIYNTISGSGQSTFDSSFRRKLGLDPKGTDYLNVDAYGPNFFSLGMFSADELLNSGNKYVNYYGYTYTGGTQSGNVTFNDYWHTKDANGNYTRPTAPYQPNYIAGYILDKFELKKDFLFNVGVRIDRYDNNTSVLKDPYSLLPEYSVSDNANLGTKTAVNKFNGNVTPSNIGGNYIVYVDQNPASTNAAAPNVVGYRSGNNWYDPYGKYVEDPSVLAANYSNGRPIQPFIRPNTTGATPKITDVNFDPSTSFTAYTPQVNIMPRISFSFPISDVALFYAHYDIYAQRPNTSGQSNIAYASPATYYYLQQTANQIISNPNLKPEKTYDYEMGFQQKLTDHSAVTISAFYKERKDQIAIRPFIDAYPTTYYTYDNTDFSTTKGVSLKYDLRRVNRLRMGISYALQFVNGTGSSTSSGNGGFTTQISPNGLLQNFIEAGVPNLRYVQPLEFDSRHNIVANADYRFANNDGPEINGRHFLENSGLNLIGSARSGEPYTRYSVPDEVTHAVIGGINSSRLPWHYNVDLKVDKDFVLNFAKKHKDGDVGIKQKKQVDLNVFIYAQNVLNIEDVIGVYGYTGRANDNGYITSSYGIAKLPSQTSALSYQDLHQIAFNDPYHYNVPRTITLGLQFNF